MHPAHPMQEGDVTLGGGFSGSVLVAPGEIESDQVQQRVVEEGAFAPGLAPWVGGRYGIDGRNDVGLTYTARTVRADARSAFDFGATALSLGLGASALLPKRRDDLGIRVGGAGFDVPVLFGVRSAADIYSGWIGARGGAELLNGQRDLERDDTDPLAPLSEEIDGWHAHVGGLLGFRVGFRYVFAIMELAAGMHWAEVSVGQADVAMRQFSVAPAGAFVARF